MRAALYNPYNVEHDNPLLDLFQRRLPVDPIRLSHPAAKQSAYRVHVPTSSPFTRSVEFFVCRESREQDAVSRDCNRLQLLAACPVSRGGTTSDPWAMSAAMEAAGDHVLYRAVLQQP
ncbi:hypothetical protein ALC57_14408 [Trachymyrmex cornetzi]|uniref:Uncharacterized protein n=1 Tax=Trachymyrmex cornetzi TaxID=471704 RepID=A0A195DKI9_9HYME|nr:hypothetical protein ALC57_14408 [Trachymyrmex cornetzi]